MHQMFKNLLMLICEKKCQSLLFTDEAKQFGILLSKRSYVISIGQISINLSSEKIRQHFQVFVKKTPLVERLFFY